MALDGAEELLEQIHRARLNALSQNVVCNVPGQVLLLVLHIPAVECSFPEKRDSGACRHA